MRAMFLARPSRLAFLIVMPLAFALAGCETFEKLNPFAEQQTPLPGVRKPLFPEGVPGVEFGAAPPQPSNSNIPIAPAITSNDNPEGQGAPQPARTQAARSPQPVQAQPAPAPAAKSSKASKSSNSDSDDAWAGTR
jgi:hypothetical protein